MALSLEWKNRTTLPVEGDRLDPEAFETLAPEAVARLPIPVGNAIAEVGDLFSVSRSAGDPDVLNLTGDFRNVQGLGRGMKRGSIVIRGHAGPYVGEAMAGGSIEVHGDVGAYAGAEMQGGRIEIHGNAGHWLGASLPGSLLGMREGVLLVHGSAGSEIGRRMRRGLIAVGGPVGDFCGKGMVAGSIFAFGPVGRFAGAGMKRGTIGLLGADRVVPVFSFASTGRFRFPFLTIYLRRLLEWGLPVSSSMFSSEFERYNGDLVANGQGEILVP